MMTLGDHDLFNGKVKFGILGFGMGKTETVHFSSAFVLSDIKMHSNSIPMKF